MRSRENVGFQGAIVGESMPLRAVLKMINRSDRLINLRAVSLERSPVAGGYAGNFSEIPAGSRRCAASRREF